MLSVSIDVYGVSMLNDPECCYTEWRGSSISASKFCTKASVLCLQVLYYGRFSP
jgi:hypothetical protein